MNRVLIGAARTITKIPLPVRNISLRKVPELNGVWCTEMFEPGKHCRTQGIAFYRNILTKHIRTVSVTSTNRKADRIIPVFIILMNRIWFIRKIPVTKIPIPVLNVADGSFFKNNITCPFWIVEIQKIGAAISELWIITNYKTRGKVCQIDAEGQGMCDKLAVAVNGRNINNAF